MQIGFPPCLRNSSTWRNQIANHAVDLFDHRLRKDFGFGADLHIGRRASGNEQALFGHGYYCWDEFAESTVTAAAWLTDGPVCEVNDAFVGLDAAGEGG